MIVTITPNPALDVSMKTESVRAGDKLRCTEVRYDPGGGGINVARVAHELGSPTLAVFPTGGFTGHRIVGMLTEAGVSIKPVAVSRSTRESFTVDETATSRQFRFVLPGPPLSVREQRSLLDTFATMLRPGTFAVASGSLPPGVSPGFYNEVARLSSERGARLFVDSSGGALKALRGSIFLLKPSLRELSEMVGHPLGSCEEQAAAARGLVDSGLAEVVVVSQAAQGALLVTASEQSWLPAVSVPPGSGVGAGDALVAGIVVGLDRGWTIIEAVEYGMAAGAAMLLTPGTAVCPRDDVERLFASQRAER